MFPKPKRVKDRRLLDWIKRNLPCAACSRKPPSDPAHITSVGAGGDDVEDNLLPLCRDHHRMQHDKGWKHMAQNFPRLKAHLDIKGRSEVYE